MQSGRITQMVALAAFAGVGFLIYQRMQSGGAPSSGGASSPAAVAPSTTRPAPATRVVIAPQNKRLPHTERVIREAEEKVQKNPNRPDAYVELARAFLQRFRETADVAYITRAEAACTKALTIDKEFPAALSLRPAVLNMQHRFAEARDQAQETIRRWPKDPMNYGYLGDALVELGDYEGAVRAINQMATMHPEPWAYARVARLRELKGNMEGAIEAMTEAAEGAIVQEPEHQAWARVQLGDLYFNCGKLAEAEREYARAEEAQPGFYLTTARLARARGAEGKYDEAIALYRKSLEIAPSYETALGLADLLRFLGKSEEERGVMELVEAMEKIHRANGIRPGYRLALYYAGREGFEKKALELAQEVAVEQKDVRTMDALAWALYANGDYAKAKEASAQAMRLGTKDGLIYFHAGMIEGKVGETGRCIELLQQALEICPYFDLRYAQQAKKELERVKAKIAQ